MSKYLLVDVSHYQTNINYNLLKENGVEALIIKSSSGKYMDSMLPIHYAGARQAGMLVGIYHWVDPIYNGDVQANLIQSINAKYPVDFICGDVEQWWGDWNKWLLYAQGKLPASKVPTLDDKRIYTVTKDFFDNVKKLLPKIPAVFYSSIGFMTTGKRNLKEIYNNNYRWLAQYPKISLFGETTWEELKKYYPSEATITLPPGFEAPHIWQWSGDRLILPGHEDSFIDLNFVYDIETWCKEPVNIENPEVITPEVPYKVARLNPAKASYLNVRKSPTVNSPSLKVFSRQSVIYITNEYEGSWVKLFNEPGWINSNYILIEQGG